MSIGTAILALTPYLYWPLGDLGSVATDVTGNGRNGTYAGPKTQQQPGVESGTYCVLYPSQQQGAIARTMPVTSGAFTALCYAALVSLNGPNSAQFMGNEGEASKGWSFGLNGPGSYGANSRCQIVRQGLAVNSFGVDVVPDAFWHQFAVTFNGTTSWNFYRDGIAVANITPGTYNATAGSSAIQQGAPDPAYLQHFAYWSSALTQPQLAGIVAAETDRTNPPWVTGQGVVNPTVFTDLTALQATADAILAAVRRTYP